MQGKVNQANLFGECYLHATQLTSGKINRPLCPYYWNYGHVVMHGQIYFTPKKI